MTQCALARCFGLDLLTKAEFEAGFGSHTPMYTGQTKCVRYYMNFTRGLDTFRQVVLKVRCIPPLLQSGVVWRDHLI